MYQMFFTYYWLVQNAKSSSGWGVCLSAVAVLPAQTNCSRSLIHTKKKKTQTNKKKKKKCPDLSK